MRSVRAIGWPCKPEQGGTESVNVLTVEKNLSGDWW